MTAQPSDPIPPRDRIVEKSRQVVLGYAAARKHWNAAPSLSALLRQMQREYEGRFLYELIQNAYDAHSVDDQGDIVVLLDLDEDEHGVLYVANSGRPFTERNFQAICALAQSDKSPDESIGNKGIGFKSVLEVCEWPEIYSAAHPGESRFGGYCFTFARREQYDELAGGDAELAAGMRNDVAPYFLPVPLDAQPPRVRDFAARGLATVIRLPIMGVSAREVVIGRITQLVDEEVPVQLFLDRLRSLEITRIGAASGTSTRTLLRTSTPVDDPAGDADQRYAHVELGEQGRWFVATRRMPVAAMRAAISESIAEGQLDESWGSWSHDVWVSVATRTDGFEIQPRLYTFLPMEGAATAPLHGHVHAPFSAMLARTSVNEQVVLNARLLDCAARASTAAVLAFREHEDVLPQTALVDLLAWDARHRGRVAESFADAGLEMQELKVVPIEPLSDGRRRATFANAFAWPYPDLTLLDRGRLARDAGAQLISSNIADSRLSRLEEHCRSLFGAGFAPEASRRAKWIETVAKKLHARRSRPRTWDRFYGELAELFARDAHVLRGRAILLGDDGALHRSPPDDEDDSHPLVFFPPVYERTDEDDEVAGDADLKPPATLRQALILMSEELTWTHKVGRTRRRTAARGFLEDHKLVRRFRTADLLEHVARALTASRRAALSRDALRFAFSLVTATRSLRQRDLRAVGLRVPTGDGWRPATDAFFSREWETPLAAPLADLIERASTSSDELSALSKALLKGPVDWPFAVGDRDAWRAFLNEIGVRDGLWPRPVARGEAPCAGSDVRPQPLARRFALAPIETDRWVRAVTATPGWIPRHPQTPYRPRSVVSVLPGQADYEALDPRARTLFAELVAGGLEDWPDGALEIVWHRHRHSSSPDERRWPSPIAAFLHEAPWMPVSDTGQRRDETFVAPRDAWYFGESRGEESPFFSPLVPVRLRRQISSSDKVLARFKRLGMGDWSGVADAPRLLRHLAGLVERDALPETGVFAFRRAYQDAWSRAAELGLDGLVAGGADLPIVVSLAGELKVVRPSDESDERVYLLGEEDSLAARILATSDLPILSVDGRDEPRIRPLVEAVLQERLITAEMLEVDVVTDMGSFTPDGSGELLVEGDRGWLHTLVALILETKRSGFGRLGPRRRREIGERLMHVRWVRTELLELRVGGVAVDPPQRHRRVIPLDDEQHPTLIVTSAATVFNGDLDALVTLAGPLCELLGIVQYEDPLVLALERLRAQHCTNPSDEDFARVLGIDMARVTEIRSHIGVLLDGMLRLLTPLVAYYEDALRAYALLDSRGALETADDLREALADVAPSLRELDRALEASREPRSLSDFRDALDLDYGRFNAALHALAPDYEPIHNHEGHARAINHYVQANRSRLMSELRLGYLTAFRDGGPLDGYIAARNLEIQPDPAWLDAYDLPPRELLEVRVSEWLQEHGASTGDVSQLPPIDVMRVENSGLIARIAGTAGQLVRAWARKHRAPLPNLWQEEAASQQILSVATERGLLDFEPLAEARVLAWLDECGWWPETMPRTLVAGEAGLAEADLRSEADVSESERQERLRQLRVLRMDGVELSAESKEFPAIFEYVTRTVSEGLLLPRRPARLQEMPESRAPTSGGRSGSTAPRWQSEGMSNLQKAAVGLVGETVAYAWLQHHYPDDCSPASWVSSYRATIGEPPGDDSLGYDFKIVLRQTTLYFEVKATTGTDTQFTLGESEVGVAAECARRRRDDYRIVFVTNALHAGRRELHILHNPMDPKHQRFYRFPGAGLKCTFWLA